MFSKRLIKQEIRASSEKYFFSKRRRIKRIARKPCELTVPKEGKPLIHRKNRRLRVHIPRPQSYRYPLTLGERREQDAFWNSTGWINGQWFYEHRSLVIQTRYDLGVLLDASREKSDPSPDPIREFRGVAFENSIFNSGDAGPRSIRPPEVSIKRNLIVRKLLKASGTETELMPSKYWYQCVRRRRKFWKSLNGVPHRNKKYTRGLRLKPTLYGLF
jgi:hypothetical protein